MKFMIIEVKFGPVLHWPIRFFNLRLGQQTRPAQTAPFAGKKSSSKARSLMQEIPAVLQTNTPG